MGRRIPKTDSYVEFLIFCEEQSQWADPHQLEAIIEAVFHELFTQAALLDLTAFGEDENLTPPPPMPWHHTVTGEA